MKQHHASRAAPSGAARRPISNHFVSRIRGATTWFLFFRSPLLLLILLLMGLGACGDETEGREVELEAVRLAPTEIEGWASPAIESGHPEITVRQVFTAQGPCRELEAELLRRYPGEYMLRVVAHEAREPCGDDTPHIGYTALLRGLPAGSHQLRIVHVGADGRTLAETVFEHPIVVTGTPAQ